MALQMRPRGTDSVPYAPARDIVYLLPSVVQNVAERLEEERFVTLHSWLQERHVTSEELAEACRAFIEFMRTAHERPKETVQEALERVGWFEVRDEARIAYIFYIGAQLMGVMWQGVRDTSILTDEVLMEMNRLADLGDQVQRALARPKWRRYPTKLWIQVKQCLIRLLQGSDS